MSVVSARNFLTIIEERFDGVNKKAERALGMSLNSIPRYLPAKSPDSPEPHTPSDRILRKILELGYSLNWFLFDVGPSMITAGSDSSLPGVIRMVPIRLGGTYLTNCNSQSFINGLAAYRIPGIEDSHLHRLFEVFGDHMEPGIYSGDWVVGRRVIDYASVRNDVPYVIVSYTKGVVVRNVVNRLQENKMLFLRTTKPAEGAPGDSVVNLGDIIEIWEVVTIITQRLPSFSEVAGRIAEIEGDLQEFKRRVAQAMVSYSGDQTLFDKLLK